MTFLALDVSQFRASSLSSSVKGTYQPLASQVEVHAPQRVVVSNPDPVAEWTALGHNTEVSSPRVKFSLPDLEWTSKQEKRFLDLAGREATGLLSPGDLDELERLSQLRRGLKNPRRGEELLWEYEQRDLTRNLLSALSRYVTFHAAPSHPPSTQS
jgi:hypothetical protein